MKNSKTILIIVGVLLGIGMFFLLYGCYKIMTQNKVNNEDKKEIVDNNMKRDVSIINNELLYSNNDIEIKIISAIPKENYVEVQFSLSNKSNDIYNFSINRLKVNNCLTYFGIPSIETNFSGVNLGVNPGESSNNYIIYIWYSDLENRGITDISTLSFKLIIYKNENFVNEFDTFAQGYIDIKTNIYDETKEYSSLVKEKDKLYSDDNIDILFGKFKTESDVVKSTYIIVNNKTNNVYQFRDQYYIVDGEKINTQYLMDIYTLYDNAFDYFNVPNAAKEFSVNSKSIKYGFSLYDNETKAFIKDIVIDLK